MLNRLYIVIGVLAIVAIAAAFIVPRFIQWGDYRDRMQAIAGEVLGAPVEIVGDIEFSLLPQPQLNFADVKVGDPDAPTITIAEVEAQFSLIDFLRDRYLITKLVLERPSLAVTIDEEGVIDAGITLAEEVTTSNVSVANAQIVDGTFAIADRRSGNSFAAANVDGDLRLDALRGPFAFQGGGEYEGRTYSARIGTAALDADGVAQLSLFLAPADQTSSFAAEGALATGASPSFSGTLTYRQSPPVLPVVEGEEPDAGRGDLVITGKVEASSAKVLLSEYVIVPDENRGATRLLGAADVTLGAAPSFNAVISGGVMALPPRDATADQAGLPYELVRLLDELPVPPIPGIEGTLGADITELDLRALSLRNVRFDAIATNGGWTLASFSGDMAGNTRVSLSGELTADAGRPTFGGTLKVTSERLDGLSTLWRKPPEGNPLFNVPASLDARVSLVGETLSISNAVLTIEKQAYPFSAEIGFASTTRHLNLRSKLGALDATASAALFAFLPDISGDARFGVSFPKGRFDIAAETATIDGLAGRDLSAKGTWDGGVLALDAVQGELGGIGFDAALTAFGTFARPELSGTAKLAIASADAPGLARLFDTVEAPQGVRGWLSRSLPAEIDFRIDAPSGEGGQSIEASGRAGAAELSLSARLGEGVLRALEGKMSLRLQMEAADPAAFTAQLGLGEVSLVPENAPMRLTAIVDGTATNSFETTLQIEGSSESIGFAGNVIAGNLEEMSGNGTIKAALSDPSGLIEALGAGGIWVPAVNGSARVDFNGIRKVRLSSISATSGGERLSGALDWSAENGVRAVNGTLEIARFSPDGLLSFLAGPAALLNSGVGYWPDGPAAVGDIRRTTTGRIAVSVPAIGSGDTTLISDAAFELTWDAESVRLRNFKGTIGGGAMTAELALCCAGPLPDKQLTGRLTLTDVAFAALVPEQVADAIGASVDAAAQFNGTGDSLHAALSAMTGEGSYTLDDLRINGIAPAAFGSIISLDEVLVMEPGEVTQKVIDSLEAAAFTAESVSGSFTIAGGVLRSPNLGIEGDGARLFGSTTLRLADLGLSGGFAMTPTIATGPDGILTEANAKIVANFAGTLTDPVRTFDVAGMVDTIMVSALEIEVARLEQVRAEEEARAAEAARERARIAAEEAARKAAEEEAKRLAAEEEERRLAEEEAARRAAEEEAARRAAEEEAADSLQPGFNLNLTPSQPSTQF